jgi:methionyl-tRNA formyltransferase
VFQPQALDADAVEHLTRVGADFFLLADYGKILPPAILHIPPLGIIGVHVSLLPCYRGPSPMQTAILNGDPETGVTLYLIDEKVDEGPMLVQEKIPLSRQTFRELREEGALRACTMLTAILPRFVAGEIEFQPQDHSQATYTKRFTTEDGFVPEVDLKAALDGSNPELARVIDRKIRALNPEPGVWTYANGLANPEAERVRYGAGSHMRITGNKRVKLLGTEVVNGVLKLKLIQTEGKNPQRV